MPAGELALTVQAVGYAPELRHVVVAPGLMPVEFRLDKGRTIRGRVVDRKSTPIPGVTVAVDFWRKDQTLDWRTRTDDAGNFRWDHAPVDAVSIRCFDNVHLPVHWHEVPRDVNEVSITMVKRLRVRGTVVDAENRHAIKSFTLVPGTESGPALRPTGSTTVHGR